MWSHHEQLDKYCVTWTSRQVRGDPVRISKPDGGTVMVGSWNCVLNCSACATVSVVKKSGWGSGDGTCCSGNWSGMHWPYGSTAGSRFVTIHFYNPCPVGLSTPDLRCITVATQAFFLYLVHFQLFSSVHPFLLFLFWCSSFKLNVIFPCNDVHQKEKKKKSKWLMLHSSLMSSKPWLGPSSAK